MTTSVHKTYCCDRAQHGRAINAGSRSSLRLMCDVHITPEVLARIAYLDKQAPSVGVKDGEWHYGPNIHLAAREGMVVWAKRHGVKWAHRKGCIHWLLTGRCTDTGCLYKCSRGLGDLRVDGVAVSTQSSWMDHVTTWSRGGKPAALVAQPYGVNDRDRRALTALGTKRGLRVEIDDAGGWYGAGTTWIAIWREGALRLTEPTPICFQCGARRGSWFVHRDDLVWCCRRCFFSPGGPGASVTYGDRTSRDPWVSGSRRDLIRWAQMAQAL